LHIFIGYAEDHTSNVFKFYNPKTYAVILSRNVYWLNKSNGKFYKVRPTASPCEIRQAHRNIAEVTYGLPDRKDPPSNAVARALFQPPDPDELPHPNFDNDNASINLMHLPLLVLTLRHLILLIQLMSLIPGHASLALVV
jgi:hypothetical protein